MYEAEKPAKGIVADMSEELQKEESNDLQKNIPDDPQTRPRRPYEDYVIENPEDMDEAPDTGDMFDDDELYDDDDDTDYMSSDNGKGRGMSARTSRRSSDRGITGRTLGLLWLVFVLLLVGYVYFLYIDKNVFAEDTTGRDNTVTLEVPDGAIYSLCKIDEINQLVNNYLLARTNADQDTLKRLVTDPSEFDDMTKIEIVSEYVTAYNRTTCYMVPGYTDGSYIIYALSNLTIKDVKSSPLDIRSMYVTRQSDGGYKINNSELSDDELAYINKINATEDIQSINRYVKENTDYLLRTDDTLQSVYDMLN